MISIPGELLISSLKGKYGTFNVAKLLTSIGEFVVKDKIIDQYEEGKYKGTFIVKLIKPYCYMYGMRSVFENRAYLDSMELESNTQLSAEDSSPLSHEADPIDELSELDNDTKSTKQTNAKDDITPFGMTKQKLQQQSVNTIDDETLFATLWPLGNEVKLDTTVDRLTLRKQNERLRDIGYIFNYKSQLFKKS